MPTRINRVIELLQQNQPIYNTGTHDLSYENGKTMSQTWGDYIGVEMEHGSFDMSALDNFMRGLVDGGPTPSGHRTPPVIMTIPTDGTSEQVIRANAWMMKQCLARGVHGILLCHAGNPRRRPRIRGILPLPIPNPSRRRPTHRRQTRRRRPAIRRPHLGRRSPTIHETRRPMAPKPKRRTLPRPKAGKHPRTRQLRGIRRHPRHRLRRMGPRRHGLVLRLPRRPRPAISRRP